MMHSTLTLFLLGLAAAAVAAAVVALAVWIVLAVRQAMFRKRIKERYGVAVPSKFHVSKTGRRQGAFRLAYPRWAAAKKDGTRDRRSNDMGVIRPDSVIVFDEWELKTDNPFTAYDMVLKLRGAHVDIAPCAEEIEKRRVLESRLADRRAALDIDGLIARFKDRPTDFEPFCAELFRMLGWQAQTTPPVRDGGFDLRLRRSDGTTYIAECKCYDRRHHVGRPVVQKLQGANAAENAQGMMLITTSSFSADAVSYAKQAGVTLVDGAALVGLCRRAYGETARPVMFPPESSCRLTREDIMRHLPRDMRNQ